MKMHDYAGSRALYRRRLRARTNFHRIMTQLKFHTAAGAPYHVDTVEQRVASRQRGLSANSTRAKQAKGRSTAIKAGQREEARLVEN